MEDMDRIDLAEGRDK